MILSNAIPIPDIYCPFVSKMSAHAQVVHDHSLDWATRLRLVQGPSAMRRFMGSRFAWLTARAYPTATSEDTGLLNDWMIWLFMFDDQFDDGLPGKRLEDVSATVREFVAICERPYDVAPRGPAAEALCDLHRRTLPQMTTPWCQRFTDNFIRYLETYDWTARNHWEGKVPEVEEYLKNRHDSGGMTVSIDLIELAEHLLLPEDLLATQAFARLRRITNNVVCWSNDIVSFAKERARGDVNNLVQIFLHTYHLSLHDALAQVNDMITAEVQLFRRIEESLSAIVPQPLGGDVGRYLDGLKAWMRANLDWSAETHRYLRVEETQAGEVVSYVESILDIDGDR
jgi:5-epi-alpha-selinene synthase